MNILNQSDKAKSLQERLLNFMEKYVYPNESVYYQQLMDHPKKIPPILEELRGKAKNEGLWNLFLPNSELGKGLTNFEYAPLSEIMGRVHFAAHIFNCAGPDSPNVEILLKYGTKEQKNQWLNPLLNGDIRSCFPMTEPQVASSDATNVQTEIYKEGNEFVINGRKWFISGAGDPKCKLAILLGKTDLLAPKHLQQSMLIIPMDSPGLRVERQLSVFGYQEFRAPEKPAEMTFKNVRIPVSNLLGKQGQGFEIAQARLGPARIHHCMRLIGIAERALEYMCDRVVKRVTFGKPLAEQGVIQEWIADSRIEIEQVRLLTLKAAYMIDTVGPKGAKAEISMIKVSAPNVALKVLDRAIQAHGAAGVSDDFPLAYLWAASRTLRIADGPDEVHRAALAKFELRNQLKNAQKV
jgi:acyl-CoA dehydrogenase